MAGIAEACPPPDTGRGRGPQDTSSAKRDEVDCGGGAGVSEANGVLRNACHPPDEAA